MAAWAKVSWTEAGQVLEQINPRQVGLATPGQSPADYCQALVDAGSLAQAVKFIGAALPRYESVVWATQVLRGCWRPGRTDPLVATVLQWIDDPNDARRRAVFALAEAEDDGPAELLGMAVFFSGGSISEPDLPAILPAPMICGRFTAGAVLNAAYDEPEPQAVLAEAVRIGMSVASQPELA